jgi:hypothetical protein
VRKIATAVVLCLQAVLWPRVADAQSGRAFTGLFGQRNGSANRPQSFDFTMAAVDGYDTGGDQAGASNQQLRHDGGYSTLDSALRYAHTRRQRIFTVSGSDSLRYEPQFGDMLTLSYDAAVSYLTPLGRHRRLNLSQSAAYTPYYQFQLFPSLPPEAGALPESPSNDYAISRQSATTFASAVALTQDLGRLSGLQFAYDFRTIRFTDVDRDLMTKSASVGFTRRARRFGAFRIAASMRDGRYGRAVTSIRTEAVEAGFDYARRRNAFSVGAGIAFFPAGGTTASRTTGNASYRLELSRKWTSSFQYNRSLQFVEALTFPFLSDSLSAALNGQVTRRLSLGISGGYSTGQVGVLAEGGQYGTYSTAGQVMFAVSRHYALYTEYLFYHYSFDEQALLGALPPLLDRHTARVGLRLWYPLAK